MKVFSYQFVFALVCIISRGAVEAQDSDGTGIDVGDSLEAAQVSCEILRAELPDCTGAAVTKCGEDAPMCPDILANLSGCTICIIGSSGGETTVNGQVVSGGGTAESSATIAVKNGMRDSAIFFWMMSLFLSFV